MFFKASPATTKQTQKFNQKYYTVYYYILKQHPTFLSADVKKINDFKIINGINENNCTNING